MPWYVRAWHASGNPFFPELYGVFGGGPATRQVVQQRQGVGLARPGRADEDDDHAPRRGDRGDSVGLIVEQCAGRRCRSGGERGAVVVSARGKEPSLGVEQPLGGVALAAVWAERGAAVVPAQGRWGGRGLGRGEQDRAARDLVGHHRGGRVALAGRREAVSLQCARDLGVDVPARPC